MDIGKINRATIDKLFAQQTGAETKTVIQGPLFGVDTALIDLGHDKGMAIASDPLSLIPSLGMKASAWLSVILTANDIATTGYLPQYAQFVLNLPHTITDNELSEYWHYIHYFCKKIGVSITGGHTGFDNMGPTTLAGGVTMFTSVELSKAKSACLARPGQDLILTKTAAISSSSILAISFPNYTRRNLGVPAQQKLADSFYQTSIITEIEALRDHPELLQQISAMHDVTEGGVLGAIFELCEASKVGVNIYTENIKVGTEQKQICELFQMDPLRSIGAGSLLIACEKGASQKIMNQLKLKQIEANIVGETQELETGRKLHKSANVEDLTYQEEDPYWAAFFKAIEKQLD